MIGLRFVVLTALVPLLGGWIAAFASVRLLPRAARIASYTAAGIVTIAAEMFALAALGVKWSLPLLLVPALVSCWILWRNPVAREREAGSSPALLIAAAAILIVAATVMAGAATSFDLLLFWGVKGVHFATAGTIDVPFLRDPANALMHSDYPPLVPLVYAWTMLGGTALGGIGLDWFGTIATAPLLLLAATAAVWGFTRSGAMTALYAATFGFLFLDNNIAGNAEPMLLFLETVALAALVCAPECEVVLVLALTGVVLTKVEGAAFAGLLILWKVAAFAWERWRSRSETSPAGAQRTTPPVFTAVVPLAALGSWIAFCAYHGLLDTYRNHPGGSHMAFAAVARPLFEEASMHAAYVPWIALGLLILVGPMKRAALPALAAAAAYFAFLVVVWAGGTEGNIAMEITWSARRVLVTPLVILFFAAVMSGRGARLNSSSRPSLLRIA